MSDERPKSPNGDRQDERDSQLSAMFDGELSAAECELLARRLSRDEALRSQWSGYALIGAALRAERGVALHDRVAWRVASAVAQEASYGDAAAADNAGANVARAATSVSAAPAAAMSNSSRWMRFARPVVGASIAAGVAAVSILWLRTQDTPVDLVADNAVPATIVLTPEPADTRVALNPPPVAPAETVASNGEPERYTTPAPSSQPSLSPPARFANYVVAHSEYSGPLARRMALLGIVSPDTPGEGTEVDQDSGQADSSATPGANDAR